MDFTNFFFPISITLVFSTIAASFYYHFYKKQDITFAIILNSLLVFSIVYFVSFDNNIGLGIGLLGILSLIRLRSTVDNLIDIGFIFYAITIGLLNASITGSLSTIIGINVFLNAVLFILASPLVFKKRFASTRIIFDDLNFDHLNKPEELKKRIRKELKIDPITIKVMTVDYLKDSVTLRITYELESE